MMTSSVAKANNNDAFALTLKSPGNGFCSGEFIESADPDDPFDIWVNAASYQSFYAYRYEDNALYGSFDVYSGGGIDFCILDQDNYDLWESGYSATAYEINYNVGSLDWYFIVPYDAWWYILYDNTDDYLYQAHVVGTHRIDTTAPTIDLNLVDGSTYSGVTEITVSAVDEGFGVYMIDLYIDDVLTDAIYDDYLTYDWQTSSLSDGEHTVRVRATDNVGHVQTEEIDIIVSNVSGLLPLVAAAGIGIPVALGLAYYFTRVRKPAQEQQSPPTMYAGPEPVSEIPEPQRTTFCRFCGAPRQSPTARYCANCGAPFGD